MPVPIGWIALAALLVAINPVSAGDAVDRIEAAKLKAVRQAILQFKSTRREIPRTGRFKEYRANLHVHSSFSHDSRGQLDEIVSAAKSVGTQIILFNEHPAPHYDFVKDGHQGFRDGVLLIPGAEAKGLLVFPRQSVRGMESLPAQEFSDLVTNREGLSFLSHLEERMDWEIRGLTGVEIYNTHADAKDEKRLLRQLLNPLWIVKTADLIKQYPQEVYSALQNYPVDYLSRWDQLCEKYPHTGVSANDAHQNIGLIIRKVDERKAVIEDALGKKILELDAAALTAILPSLKADEKNGVLFQIRLDPYEIGLRHVGTHLLMPELTVDATWQALQEGRAFVAFDWIADSTGFDLFIESLDQRLEMGSQTRMASNLRLRGESPLTARWKVIHNGKLLTESTGIQFETPIERPGRYRMELWLNMAGEEYPWILSNPFYISP